MINLLLKHEIKYLYGNQTNLASELGTDRRVVSTWVNGAGISKKYREKLLKLGFSHEAVTNKNLSEYERKKIESYDVWKICKIYGM